jgi:cytochrome c nitrite reductase small subunit
MRLPWQRADRAASRSGRRRGWLAGGLLVVTGGAIGAAIGLGGYTFIYARGASYFTNEPSACANCHIMREQYDGWRKSSHHAVATCNDCHTPPGLVAKYLTKASNGFWHSFYFTTGSFPEPIRIRERNRSVTETACRKCHADIAEALASRAGETAPCLHCHNSVGHPEGLGRTASLE